MKVITFSLRAIVDIMCGNGLAKQKMVLLLLIFFTIMTSLKGQEIQEINPQVPTSPQAETFKQYGEYAVNYSTGVPDISIPLYEINHRGYKIPLELKYNPKPLKPGYNYDVYGHGWSLSVNSCVSRSIEFCPDEWRDFKIQTEKLSDYYYYPEPGIFDFSQYNFAHDKFNVVLPNGSSFDFIMDYGANGPVYTISDGKQVKISCNYNSANINSFTIIDEDGVKYTFNGSDTPYKVPATPISNSYVSWQLTRIDLPNTSEPITFSYNYTIESPLACSEFGIIISEGYHVSGTMPYIVTAKNDPNAVPYSYRMKLLSSISYGTTNINLIYHDQNTTTTYNYVDKIEVHDNAFREIVLNKTITAIQDYCSSNNLLAKLESVSIKGSGTMNPLIYRCAYNSLATTFSGTDHWGYSNRFNTRYDVANLNFFVDFDADHYNIFSSARLSEVTKSALDLCPYDKVKLSTNTTNNRQPDGPEIHGVLSRLTYPTGGYSDFVFENHEFLTSTDNNGNYILDRNNRIKTKAAGFRIKKITNYSSDGVAKIMNYMYGKTYGELYGSGHPYASHHTGLGEVVVDPNILTYMTFSHNFETITDKSNYFIRNMILGLNEDGEYISFANPFHSTEFTFTSSSWGWKCTFSSLNFRRILNGRPPVIYSDVTVYYGDIDNGPENTIGKTVYHYNITEHGTDLIGNEFDDLFFEAPIYFGRTIDYNSKSYKYNKLNEQVEYKFDGLEFVPVKKETYNWVSNSTSKLDYTQNTPYPDLPYYLYARVNEFLSSKSSVLGVSQLSSKQTIMYDNDNRDIIASENYSYNSRNQLINTNIINSDGQTVKTSLGYPEINSGGETPEIIQKMVDKNIISPVISKNSYVGPSESSMTEISGSLIEYDEFIMNDGTTKVIKPSKSYELEISSSGSEYVLKDEILDYSENGNPLESIGRDGISKAYIWGYSDRYPTAIGMNAQEGEIAYTGFEPYSPDGWNYGSSIVASDYKRCGRFGLLLSAGEILTSPELETSGEYYIEFFGKGNSSVVVNGYTQQLNSDYNQYKIKRTLNANSSVVFSVLSGSVNLDEIRIYPVDAHITTYTYEPMIGMTSQTDPNGQVTTYEYDGFGRLKRIKDHQGNILKQYEYHYQINN